MAGVALTEDGKRRSLFRLRAAFIEAGKGKCL